MLISGLLALVRGFTREVLSLVAWGVAGLAGLAGASIRRSCRSPSNTSHQEIAAQIAVGAGGLPGRADHRLADQRQDLRLGARSPVGAFDRTLGFAYGAGPRVAPRGDRLSASMAARAAATSRTRWCARRDSCRWSSPSAHRGDMLPAQIQERIQNTPDRVRPAPRRPARPRRPSPAGPTRAEAIATASASHRQADREHQGAPAARRPSGARPDRGRRTTQLRGQAA